MHQIFPLLRLFLSLELNLGICRHQQLPLPGREEQLLTTQLIMRLDYFNAGYTLTGLLNYRLK